jgi:L-ascorbate metabolism protein UlaG (beta-lactamase superfamily)
MKITKFVHSCLLVENADASGRVALFDPGVYCTLNVNALSRLDDIFITHSHGDHMDVDLIARLFHKFPDVRITTTAENVATLEQRGIMTATARPEGVSLFDSPHEVIRPFLDVDPPQEIGVHYLDLLSHPGDSHSFSETKAILALPVQAPWGSPVDAVALALKLKPQFVIPIHDWHWSDAARASSYENMEKAFTKEGITFIKAVSGEPFELEV